MHQDYRDRINELSSQVRKSKVNGKWEIDGKVFEELWGVLENIVILVASRKGRYSDSLQFEDIIAEVRFAIFRFFSEKDPDYISKDYSYMLSGMISKEIKRINRDTYRKKRGGDLRIISLHEWHAGNRGLTRFESAYDLQYDIPCDDLSYQITDITSHLARSDKEIVSRYLREPYISGRSVIKPGVPKISDIAEDLGISTYLFKQSIMRCLD